MFHRHESDVLVAGAGPVGLFAALTLARRNVKVRVFEEAWREATRSYALVLHRESLRLLEAADLLGLLLERGRRVDSLAFYDGPERRRELRFHGPGGSPEFLLVVPQSELEIVLVEALHRAGVKVRWNHRVARLREEGGWSIAEVERLDKVSTVYAAATTEWVIDAILREKSRYVIGADGHNSMIRRALGIDFESVGPADLFAIFEFETREPSDQEVRVILNDDDSNVLWPLPGNRWRFSCRVPDDSEGELARVKSRLLVQIGGGSFEHLGEGALEWFIQMRAPWFKAGVTRLHWSVMARFEKRLASRFGCARGWLAGDAAHLAAPIAVQSLNRGLREAHDLAECLVEVIKSSAPPDTLEEYGRRHREEWCGVLGLEGRCPLLDSTDEWVRSRATAIWSALPASGEALDRLIEQL
jgi:2-polyprenyl-6-methoxyphenol hydroxylase-like FAD-dependent oxidoreductase